MKIGLISLGCSKNLVDSENILGFLINKRGFELVENLETADIVVVNTCAFIGDAKEESIEAILEAAEYKTNGNLKKLVVAGCLSERYRDELINEIPEIDAVIGTGDIEKICEIVDSILDGNKEVVVGSQYFLPNCNTERIIEG